MIPFIKAHACGNDFLIISEEATQGFDKSQLTQRLCDRYTGIGADGIEFFAWTGDMSAKIQLYNADGSIAEISGNGTRCVAAWMAEDKNGRPGDEFSIETGAGIRICKIDDYRPSSDIGPTVMVTSDMGVPSWQEQTVELADGTQIDGVTVNVGNPHFVIVLPASNMVPSNGDLTDPSVQNLDFSINDRSWQEIGEEICFHADFPQQTNVEFVIPIGVVRPAQPDSHPHLRARRRSHLILRHRNLRRSHRHDGCLRRRNAHGNRSPRRRSNRHLGRRWPAPLPHRSRDAHRSRRGLVALDDRSPQASAPQPSALR